MADDGTFVVAAADDTGGEDTVDDTVVEQTAGDDTYMLVTTHIGGNDANVLHQTFQVSEQTHTAVVAGDGQTLDAVSGTVERTGEGCCRRTNRCPLTTQCDVGSQDVVPCQIIGNGNQSGSVGDLRLSRC